MFRGLPATKTATLKNFSASDTRMRATAPTPSAVGPLKEVSGTGKGPTVTDTEEVSFLWEIMKLN